MIGSCRPRRTGNYLKPDERVRFSLHDLVIGVKPSTTRTFHSLLENGSNSRWLTRHALDVEYGGSPEIVIRPFHNKIINGADRSVNCDTVFCVCHASFLSFLALDNRTNFDGTNFDIRNPCSHGNRFVKIVAIDDIKTS